MVKRYQFKIEKVRPNNFSKFINLVIKLAEYEKLTPPGKSTIKRLRHDAFSKKPRFEAYLGKFGGEYVAYMIFFQTYSSFLARPTLFLEDIFILEKYRRKGLGKIMFKFYEIRARQLSCGRLEWIVLDWNTPAQKFYDKNDAKRLKWYFYRKVLN